MESQKKEKNSSLIYTLARRAAWISAVVAVILSILLIANYIQIKSVDPLNSPALTALMEELENNPDDTALKQQIRALDLLARKSYFATQWQIRTGSVILFVSVLVLLVSLKTISSGQAALPDLETPRKDTWNDILLSRRYLIYSGIVVFVLAFLLGVLSETQLTEKSEPSAGAMDEMARQWPAFRGPGGNGHAFVEEAPATWNGESGDNVLWKVQVPKPGFNSPVIWDDRLYLSGADTSSQEVYCYDTASGELQWTTELNDIPGHPAELPFVDTNTGYTAPTMALDGKHVCVIYATGDLACLDEKGNVQWAKNIGVPDNHYGHSSSLMIYRNLLLVQYDTNSSQTLYGFNLDNGEQVYATERQDVQISWASPLLVNTGNRFEVILNSNPWAVSYDPATGAELWRVDCMYGEVAPSPAYSNGFVFVVNEYAQLAAIKLEGTPHIAWAYEDDLSEAPSPLAVDNLLFMASTYGTVTCFDIESGEVHWTHDFDEGFYSSPIRVLDRVYLMDRDGVMQIFKAKDKFELIAENPLGEEADTIPAFKDGRLYIRGMEHLFCIGE